MIVGYEVSRYRIIVGYKKWAVALERFDVNFSVYTTDRYNDAPRKGNISGIIRIFGA